MNTNTYMGCIVRFYSLITVLLVFWPTALLQAQPSTYRADSIKVYELGNQAFALRAAKPDSALLLADEALRLAETIRDIQAQVSLWRIKGVVHYGQQQMDQAYEHFERAYRLARRIHFREARLLINLGNVDFYRQDFDGALKRYQQALAVSERKDTVSWMDALNNIGSTYIRKRQFRLGVDALRSSLDLQQATNSQPTQLPTLLNLGDTYRKLNLSDQAAASFQQGLQLAITLNDSTWIATFHKYIARVYSDRAFYVQSLEAGHQALSIYTELEDSLAIANTLHNIGTVHQDNEDYPAAKEYFEKALAIHIRQANTRSQASSLNSIGRNLILQQQYAAARKQLQRSIALYRQLNLNNIRYPFYNLGDSYERTGQLDSASFYLQAAYEIADSTNDYYLESLALTGLGQVAQKRGAAEEAILRFKAAIKAAGIESMRKEELIASGALYRVLRQQGRPAEALVYLERHHELQDSLFNEESTRKIAQVEAQYVFEQEKKTITEQNAAEKRQLDERIRQERASKTILATALVLTLIAFLLLYQFQRFRKKSERERQRLNEEINSQRLTYEQKERERLQEIDTFKSRFFANISHELRTPLTLILSPTKRLLQQHRLGQRERAQLQLVQQNAEVLLARVNEILDLTKFDARQMQLQETPTAFYDFCKRLAANFESFAQQKQQQYVFEYRLDKALNILLDRTKFTHVFNNYLSNAIKYTPRSGKIRVALYESANGQSGQLVLEVKDNGIGIREKDQPHLFDRFYQVDERENKAGGSGIGLALSQEAAQAMQGEVWVQSEWGAGSTFYFRFPYREVMGVLPVEDGTTAIQQYVNLEPLIPDNEPVPNRPKVMVVEDNKQLRDYLKLILSDHYEVTTAGNGEAALQKLPNWNGQLIVSDVMMPKMDGFELISQLKNTDEYRHLPVIMLTARTGLQDKLRALRIGVDDYLLKPFVEDELLTRANNLLENYRNRRKGKLHHLPAPSDISAADLLWLEKLEDLLKQEVHNPEFTFDHLEAQLFISRRQLQRRIKKLTGLTPNKYFREIKLQVARELLESGRVRTVNEVAHAVGFETAKYFSRIYAERFGKRPIEWL